MTPEEDIQQKYIVQSFYDPVRVRINDFKKKYPEATIDPYIHDLVYTRSNNRTVPSTDNPVYKQLSDSISNLSDEQLGKILAYNWRDSIGSPSKMMKAIPVVKPALKGVSLSDLTKWGNGFTFGKGGIMNYSEYLQQGGPIKGNSDQARTGYLYYEDMIKPNPNIKFVYGTTAEGITSNKPSEVSDYYKAWGYREGATMSPGTTQIVTAPRNGSDTNMTSKDVVNRTVVAPADTSYVAYGPNGLKYSPEYAEWLFKRRASYNAPK